MKPQLIRRIGNRFDIDDTKILPYLRKNKDYIVAAVKIACQEFKVNPKKYNGLNQYEKLNRLNETVYQILKEWGVYKEKESKNG